MTLYSKPRQTSIKRCFSSSTSAPSLACTYCSQHGSDLCCWVANGLMKWTQVSSVPEGWLSHARGEEHCQFSHMTGFWVTYTLRDSIIVCAIDIHSSIDANHLHSPQIGHTHGHHHWLTEARMCLLQTLWCNLSLPCRCLHTNRGFSLNFVYM